MYKTFKSKPLWAKITIIFIAIIPFFLFLPFIMGGSLAYIANKKISNQKIKYSLLSLIAVPTLFIGSVWTTAMMSSDSYTPVENNAITPTPEVTPITTKAPTPTVKPNVLGAAEKKLTDLYKVVSITDGDTIKVNIDGKVEKIRLIGIDTPESVDPRKPVQCFSKEATDKAKDVLTEQRVRLEADDTQDNRDKYQRLLRYVFLEDDTNFNQLMIREGYAHEYTYTLPYKYQTEFKKAEEEARINKRGLWADSACPTPTTVKPTLKPTSVSTKKYIPPVQKEQPPIVSIINEDTIGGGFICDCAKTCSQMSSCAEAQYQLNVCGCTRRDGDSDGIACDTDCQ